MGAPARVRSPAVGSASRVWGLEAGADGYLVQPIEPDELIATIARLAGAAPP